MRPLLVLSAMLLLAFPARASENPRTWPIGFSEVYHFPHGGVSQITLSWEGLKARRFFLRLRSPRSFDATLVRERDGSFLYGERRATLHEAVIPWGVGEVAHLSVSSRHDEGVYLTLEVATDPTEEGLQVYSLHVNRFLDLYREGETQKAEAALEQALREDPRDETARLLMERLWKEEGLTEPPVSVDSEAEEQKLWRSIAEDQRMAESERAAREALESAGPDSARARLGALDSLQTSSARARWLRLDGEIALREQNFSRAAFAFYDALDEARAPALRREIYRLLVEANLALGNEAQAREVVRKALDEAQDEPDRQAIRSWLKERP